MGHALGVWPGAVLRAKVQDSGPQSNTRRNPEETLFLDGPTR
jgi:hypothetical protein